MSQMKNRRVKQKQQRCVAAPLRETKTTTLRRCAAA